MLSRKAVRDQIQTRVRWGIGHGLPRFATQRAAKQGDLQGRLIHHLDPENPQQMHAIADAARDRAPLVKGSLAYLTAKHSVVHEVLTNSEMATGIFGLSDNALGRLANWAEESAGLGPLTPPSLLVTEPPDHTRYRKLVTRVFSVRAVENLRERTQTVADDLLNQLDPNNPVDLVEQYCAQLPVTIICEILGVPHQDRDRVLTFGEAAAPSLDIGLDWRTYRDVERSLLDFEEWLDQHIEHLRRNPGEDLMSKLVAAHEDGERLSRAELKSTAGLVLAAGFETTVNLLSNGISLLVQHREQRHLLQQQPELWGNAVDEILRYDPPVMLTGRHATTPTEIAGHPIPVNGMVTTMLAGANRDPEVFDDPHTFDVTRENAREHVSFSAGRHYCLGAALARMEGEVGLRSLFDRYPDLQLTPGARRRTTKILRGYATLPAVLTAPPHKVSS